jgi:glycerophosphoryl diester phosphodiesterase
LGLPALYRPAAQAFQIPEAHGRFRIGPSFVAAAHRHAMEVHIWTVNETAAMRRLLSWHVDGIITDYPDKLLRLLRDQGEPAAAA